MVSYCCVNGCNNNSSDKKKYPNHNITFHAFPSNSKVRTKWLQAIGRPSWEPPTHARVCSNHFTDDQINREHQRTRLKEDACPTKELPEECYDSSSVEVCRICLVVDVKMFSLRSEFMKMCFKSIIGLAKESSGLPQWACYSCAAQLAGAARLVRRAEAARTALLALLDAHGKITKDHVKKIDRKKLNLESSLSFNRIVPKTVVFMQYDEDLHTSYVHTSETVENFCKQEFGEATSCIGNKVIPSEENVYLDVAVTDLLSCKMIDNSNDNFVNVDVKNDLSDDEVNFDGIETNIDLRDDETDDLADDLPLAVALKIKKSESVLEVKKEKPKQSKPKKKSSRKNAEGLTPEEEELQKHFHIVIQTLQEQIEERLKMKESPAFRDGLYKCEICYRTYLHPDAFKMHMDHHDPSRGSFECGVCRARYGSAARAASHAARAHGTRLHCRRCAKVFTNVFLAKKHLRRHEGFVYKCDQCDFSSVHESALSAHARTAHWRLACGACGRAFRSARGLRLHARAHRATTAQKLQIDMFFCKVCDIGFATEEAWKDHMNTSALHEESNVENGTVASEVEPAAPDGHAEAACKMPLDCYPTDCEHCGRRVASRKEHYSHVRREHPRERHRYRPVVAAVCDTCGKGFQNSTKLHLHELRHTGLGTVRCPHCPRLFYDKFQLARHAGVHSDARPHACQLCPKAFKLRSNLDRHAKVHSGATPYECSLCGKRFRYSSSRNLHVRTVHYKLPQPPRKKRPAKSRLNFDAPPTITTQ